MSAEKTIRAQARQRLKEGGWAKALFGFAVLVFCYMLVDCFASIESVLLTAIKPNSTITLVIEVLSRTITIVVALMLSPAVLGYLKMLYSDNKEYDMKDVLYFFTDFKRYIKSVAFVFIYIIRMIIPTALCYLPVAGVVMVDKYVFSGFMDDVVYAVTFYTLIVFSSIALIVFSTRYFLCVKLYCDDEKKPLSQYFTDSIILMNGHTNYVLKLIISYVFWIMLCVTVMPILYVFPYFTQAMCISGKWITDLSRNGQGQ